MMTKLGTLKRGDTLSFYIDLKNGNTAITGAATKLKSQVRNGEDTLLTDLDIREDANTAGRYIFQNPTKGETQNWSGTIYFDIQYTDGDIVRSTETMSLVIEKDITRDE